MSGIASPEWNIKTRSSVCQTSGRPFQEDEPFYTLLIETPEGLLRTDMCQEAWESREPAPDMVSYWKSIFKPDPPVSPDAVRKEDAESELRRLLENLAPENHKTCYLLALLLERKRILKSREKITRNGQKLVAYEHALTQETLLVPEIEFKLTEMDGLIAEISSGHGMVFRVNEPVEPIPEEVPAQT